jgi:LysR family hydrogen peroxide-inducible transcriptional activator
MNLQQIEYIVALDELKSFSKAAEACFITQATLSTMVKKLEQELDMVIFDRKKNPIITTDYGKEIIEEAKKILIHSNNIKFLPSKLKGKIEGDLKLGIIPTIASNLLHRIIPNLLNKYPNLKLKITEITTNNIINQLKTGEIDVGIVSTPLPKNEFEEEILYYEKLMVYGKIKNSQIKYLSPKDIAYEKVWLLEQDNCLSNQIMNVCSLSPKTLYTNLDFKPNSFDSLINMVDNTDGLTLIPELYHMDLAKEKKVKVIDFNSPYPVREVSLIYNRPYAKLRLINAFAEEIKQTILPILHTSKLKNKEMIIAKM